MHLREQSATGRTVVLLIDYDNLQICASRDTPGQDLDLPFGAASPRLPAR